MFEEGQEILDKRYRVIKKLGGGAFGEIFKGKQKKVMLVNPTDLNDFHIYVCLILKHHQILSFGIISKHDSCHSLSVLYLCL